MIQKIFDLFRTPPVVVAKRELAQAYLRTLEAHAAKEYAQSVIDLNATRIERLEAFIAEGDRSGKRPNLNATAAESRKPKPQNPTRAVVRSV